VFNELHAHFNPPPPAEPQIVYVEPEEQFTSRLGHANFDPALMAKPHKWW
jgi:hypothetical protein